MLRTAFVVVLGSTRVGAHGVMNIPPSRNAGPDAGTRWDAGCPFGACMFFSQGCWIGCPCNEENNFTLQENPCGYQEPELTARADLTFQRGAIPQNLTNNHPWRSPGTAIPLDACGLAGGSTKNNDPAGGFGNETIAGVQGFPGSKLNATIAPIWVAGQAVEVSWAIAANHGGGYQYRICPEATPTEDCFQKNVLDFVGDASWLQWLNGTRVEIPARRVAAGTGAWTKNPIPACSGVGGGYENQGCDEPQFAPPPGCDETCWGYQRGPRAGTRGFAAQPATVDSSRRHPWLRGAAATSTRIF